MTQFATMFGDRFSVEQRDQVKTTRWRLCNRAGRYRLALFAKVDFGVSIRKAFRVGTNYRSAKLAFKVGDLKGFFQRRRPVETLGEHRCIVIAGG